MKPFNNTSAPQVYWPCCTHCRCNPKEKRAVHTLPCSRCQDID